MREIYYLVKRNILLYIRDYVSVFFSVLSMLIVLALMVIFLGNMNSENVVEALDHIMIADKMHEDYHNAGIHINDVDFLIENATNILMVEYKNACIANAENPAAFHPMTDKKISIATRKFYDSLHYLRLLDKNKPIQY